jgi:hypothetical protein
MEAVDALERDPLLQAAVEPDRPVGRSLQRSPYLTIARLQTTRSEQQK